MKNFFLLFFFTSSFFSQIKNDTIPIKNDTEELFSNDDLAIIDSLLLDFKYKSPLNKTAIKNQKNSDENDNFPLELTTELLKERLEILNSKTPFQITFNPILEKVIKLNVKKRKSHFTALISRAGYYFPMFEKHLDQYNIPLELKYLAVIESSLDAAVKSPSGASGLWQFMYNTGIQYKLKVTSYIDERQDPLKATKAACKYLSDLFTIFGDWNLVLAAYNSGAGNVAKAIKRSGGHKNYWNIRPFLPSQTADYVPNFYATMYLFEFYKEHQLSIKNTPIRYFETDTVQIKKTVTFNQISKTIGVRNEVLKFLNPAFKLNLIPFVEGKNYVVTLPRKSAIQFIQKEKEMYDLAQKDASKKEKPLPTFFKMDKPIQYKVKSGDFLGKIASTFGVRISDIKKWNQLKTDHLKLGQLLSIYPKK